MSKIKQAIERDDALIEQLVVLWESAVRATHDFLSEEDIIQLKPEVVEGVKAIEHLYLFVEEPHRILGFVGVQEGKIEMLFVDASARGRGVGKKLLTFVCDTLDARLLDVNEQNEQAVGFYYHVGFRKVGRSACDDQGRPFPLLHLELPKE